MLGFLMCGLFYIFSKYGGNNSNLSFTQALYCEIYGDSVKFNFDIDERNVKLKKSEAYNFISAHYSCCVCGVGGCRTGKRL